MSPLQRLQLRQSELRERINELLGLETRSDEQTAELRSLTTEGQNVEVEIRAAIVAEPEPPTRTEPNGGDPEGRERIELRSRFQVNRVIGAVLQGRLVDGVEAECAAAEECARGQIPVGVYERRQDGPALETRAVTPGPSTVGVNQRPIVPAIFDRSIAPYLRIEMPNAGVGDQAFPILSTNVSAEVKAKDAAAPETAGAVTVTSVEPRRVTGSFRFRVEDAARLSGLEEALRRNLSMVLSDQVDNQVLNGSAADGGEDGKVRGLLAILSDPTAPATGAETWARMNTAFLEKIDGRFAIDETGVKALVGPHTLRHAAGLFRGNNTEESFSAVARRTYGGIRATRRIADPASNLQQAVFVRENPANDSCAVMAHWNSMTIRDVYSDAAKGQVVVTAYMLVSDVVVLRSDCFVQDSFRLG